MIYKPSGEQEEILGGVNTRLHLLKKEGHSLSLPIQMLGWHRGGQIDTTSLETITQVNLAAGIEYAWERAGAVERLFTKIGRAQVCTPVTNAHLVCRLLLEIKIIHILINHKPQH